MAGAIDRAQAGKRFVPGLAGSLSSDARSALEQTVKGRAHSGTLPGRAADHWRAFVNHHADQFLPDIAVDDLKTGIQDAVNDAITADGSDADVGSVISTTVTARLQRGVDSALTTIDRLLTEDLDVASPRLLNDARAKLEAAETVQQMRRALKTAGNAIDIYQTDAPRADHTTPPQTSAGNGGSAPDTSNNTPSETRVTIGQLKSNARAEKQDYVQARRVAQRAINAYNQLSESDPAGGPAATLLGDLEKKMDAAMAARDAAFDDWQAARRAVEDANGM